MKNEPFRLDVNQQYEFDLLPEQIRNLDIIEEGGGALHLLQDGQAFRARIMDMDPDSRTYVIRVNDRNYTVKLHDHYDRLVQELGLKAGSSHKENIIKAPMPGLVLNIMVEPGQVVTKGDPLLILEAMKMENVIKAASDGEIRMVMVNKGQAVDKGTLLIEMA